MCLIIWYPCVTSFCTVVLQLFLVPKLLRYLRKSRTLDNKRIYDTNFWFHVRFAVTHCYTYPLMSITLYHTRTNFVFFVAVLSGTKPILLCTVPKRTWTSETLERNLTDKQLYTTRANERKANLQLLCQKQANGSWKAFFLASSSAFDRTQEDSERTSQYHWSLQIANFWQTPWSSNPVFCAQMSFTLIYQLVMSLFSCTQSRIS